MTGGPAPTLPIGTATSLGPTDTLTSAVTDSFNHHYYSNINYYEPSTPDVTGGVLAISGFGSYTFTGVDGIAGTIDAFDPDDNRVQLEGHEASGVMYFTLPIGYFFNQIYFYNGTSGSISATFTATFTPTPTTFWQDFTGPITG